jgi:transposase
MGKSITDLSEVTTVGLDLAKHIFQIHGLTGWGALSWPSRNRRNNLLESLASLPPCLVGLEACGSAHHWARELKLGHDARMMPPAYVKPYVRRQKNDAADAAAICEAATRPSMRFVGVRSLENQTALMSQKTREMLISQRTQLINGLRGHVTEVGVIAAQGPRYAPRTGRSHRGWRRDDTAWRLRGAGAPRRTIAEPGRSHCEDGSEGRNGASTDERSRCWLDYRVTNSSECSGRVEFLRPQRIRRLSQSNA